MFLIGARPGHPKTPDDPILWYLLLIIQLYIVWTLVKPFMLLSHHLAKITLLPQIILLAMILY